MASKIPCLNSALSSKDKLKLYARTSLALPWGLFDVHVFRNRHETEHVVISLGDLTAAPELFVRVHSECWTGEVLGSLRCDCKSQLNQALEEIARRGSGLVIYLRDHEGRGIGLGNKIRAYELQQSRNLDTVQANHALGFPDDLRSFADAIGILKFFGISKIRLNTNNPDKVSSLEKAGIEVLERIPSLTKPNPHNAAYLLTKHQTLGHHLEDLF